MPEDSDRDEIRSGRRGFFREGLRHIIRPLAEFVEEKLPDMISEPDPLPYYPAVPIRNVLRPPGAQPEQEFLNTCYRSGNCIEVCPVQAIKVLENDDSETEGTPFIDADLTACVACEAVYCTKSCPSGALTPIDDPKDIRIGLARVDEYQCVRSHGEDCEICVEKCPIGLTAIRIEEAGNRIEVIEGGCTGCGVCQQHCPTLPKAIVIDPVWLVRFDRCYGIINICTFPSRPATLFVLIRVRNDHLSLQ